MALLSFNDLADARDTPGGMYHGSTVNFFGVIFDSYNTAGVVDLHLEDPILVAEKDFHILCTSCAGNVSDLQRYLFDHFGFSYLCKIAVIQV